MFYGMLTIEVFHLKEKSCRDVFYLREITRNLPTRLKAVLQNTQLNEIIFSNNRFAIHITTLYFVYETCLHLLSRRTIKWFEVKKLCPLTSDLKLHVKEATLIQ